ncbi:unnamed protein product [Ectocarpus sp. CCAP 1310/34]|nr:unnamed protein product [Ectocarpus sp. CCAP 1310/34]
MGDEKRKTCFELAIQNVQCGAGMGLLFGAVQESFKNPPQPRPTDKVVLNPPKSDVMAKAMSSMGRQAFMMAAVAAVYSAGECGSEYVRGKDDVVNSAVGACMAAGAAGLKTGKISHACAGCLGGAVIMSAVRLGTDINGSKSLDRARLDAKRAGKREKLEGV